MNKRRMKGAAVLLLNSGRIGLILRDNKQNIEWPNTWAPPGGEWENGEENLLRTAIRELLEELGIKPDEPILALGVTPDGIKGVFFCRISTKKIREIRLKEGRNFQWFTPEQISKIVLGGVFRKMFLEHGWQVEEMVRTARVPEPEVFGLKKWNGE